MPDLVCLTLLIPAQAEERLIDFLLSHDDGGIEFSVHPVAARGPLVKMAASEEQVSGHAVRTEAKLILERVRCEALLAPLNDVLAGVDGGYWITPVSHFSAFRPTPKP